MDHIVGLCGKNFLAAKIWEMGQKQEFLNLLKTLVLDTNLEKLKIDQKCFNWVWGKNRMNKFSWIKLVCYGCDMLIAFTPLQCEAAMNGSLYASYCEQPR